MRMMEEDQVHTGSESTYGTADWTECSVSKSTEIVKPISSDCQSG